MFSERIRITIEIDPLPGVGDGRHYSGFRRRLARGKEALWTALQSAGLSFERIDLDALADSARAQAREVDELRLSAVANTFREVDGEGES